MFHRAACTCVQATHPTCSIGQGVDGECADVALKVESPPCLWEWYVCRALQGRLPADLRAGFIDPCALLLGARMSVLVAPFGCHGSLQEALNLYLAAGAPPPEVVALHFAGELLGALGALAGARVLHADLKPDNLLLRLEPLGGDENAAPALGLTLIDFGRSVDMELLPPGARLRGDSGAELPWAPRPQQTTAALPHFAARADLPRTPLPQTRMPSAAWRCVSASPGSGRPMHTAPPPRCTACCLGSTWRLSALCLPMAASHTCASNVPSSASGPASYGAACLACCSTGPAVRRRLTMQPCAMRWRPTLPGGRRRASGGESWYAWCRWLMRRLLRGLDGAAAHVGSVVAAASSRQTC